jgi:hypothetical protein
MDINFSHHILNNIIICLINNWIKYQILLISYQYHNVKIIIVD